MDANAAELLRFVVMMQAYILLYINATDFLGDVSNLAKISSSFSPRHIFCMFFHV